MATKRSDRRGRRSLIKRAREGCNWNRLQRLQDWTTARLRHIVFLDSNKTIIPNHTESWRLPSATSNRVHVQCANVHNLPSVIYHLPIYPEFRGWGFAVNESNHLETIDISCSAEVAFMKIEVDDGWQVMMQG